MELGTLDNMRLTFTFLAFALVACTPKPASCPPVEPPKASTTIAPESLQDRRKTCDKLWNHGLTLVTQKKLNDAKVTLSSDEFEAMKAMLEANLVAAGKAQQFTALCLGSFRKDQLQCALNAIALDTMYACLDDEDDD